MPRYSVVIPFYKGFPYIEQCVNSVLSQDCDSLEILIVDDRDPEDTGKKLDDIYGNNERVKVIHRQANGGTLQARRDGILASSGDFVFLMDQDDILLPGALIGIDSELAAKPVDILHFKVKVVAETEAAKDACEGMTNFLTPPLRELSNQDILRYQFAKPDGFDWQVHHKVYSGDLARKAWNMAGDAKLSYADDVFASFIICALAKTYRSIDKTWYEYHLGRGETLNVTYDINNFKRWCDADSNVYEIISEFIKKHKDELVRDDYDDRLMDIRNILVEHSINELSDNLDIENRQEAIDYALEKWSADAVAGELWRFVRDRAYKLFDLGQRFELQDILVRYLEDAIKVDKLVDDSKSKRYSEMRSAAIMHMGDLQTISGHSRCQNLDSFMQWLHEEEQEIRIFVTTHKDVELFDSNILQPIQVGPSDRYRFEYAYQDDTFNNISNLNPMYCELTTQYWAWKNIDAKYYGFCHYRRYFNFSDNVYEENPWGEVVEDYINNKSREKYCLDDESITNAIDGFDIITTMINNVGEFPDAYKNIRDHYEYAYHLRVEHIDLIAKILKEEHPDYAQDADEFLYGKDACFCNMYVMKKELFFSYCEWMFPLLEKFMDQWDPSTLSHEGMRTPGHLSERLFNIWLNHQKRTNEDLKHKQVQCVHFEHPERKYIPRLEQTCNLDKKETITVVFAADNNYVPMLTTTIYSMLCNASNKYFYDIVVLEKDISASNKDEMSEFLSQFNNVSLRFAFVGDMLLEYDLQTNNEHISIETYYRFLIQKILPNQNKALYLDSDLIINGDISELYNTELGDNMLAAAHDIDFLGNLNMNDGWRMNYAKEVLQMKNPYDYFQAGVLLLNLEEMRKLYSFEEWLHFASDPKYIYNDQDILNCHCEGRVLFLDNSWNVMNNCIGRIQSVFSFAPANIYDEFMAAYANPKIIHYAGFEKPWRQGYCDLSTKYWKYARQIPFYEELIEKLSIPIPEEVDLEEPDNEETDDDEHEACISEDSPLRNVFDGVMPMGTKRREAAKAAVRFVRGKK